MLDSGITIKQYKNLFDKGVPLTKFLPYIAYDPQRKIYILSGSALNKKRENFSIGAIFEINTLPGELVDSNAEKHLSNILETIYTSGSFEEGTAVQFIIFSSKNFQERVRSWRTRKKPKSKLLHQFVDEKERFLLQGNYKKIRGFITVRHFTSDLSEHKLDEFRVNLQAMKATLETIEWGKTFLNPVFVDPENLIKLVSEVLTQEKQDISYNTNLPIRDQIQYRYIHVYPRFIDVSGYITHVVSVKSLPTEPHVTNAVKMLGDLYSESLQLNTPFMITFNTTILDQFKMKAQVEKRHTIAQMQSNSFLGTIMPHTNLVADDLNIALQAAEMGKQFIRYSLHYSIFAKDEKEAKQETQKVLNILRLTGFTPFEEGTIGPSVFISSLPMNYDPRIDRFMVRQKTIMSHNIASITPLFADWKGSKTPVLIFNTRRNEILTLDLFDSPGNYNTVVAAASGSGKSFLVNDIVCQYLSEGAIAFILDVGKSYQKLCEFIGGDFVEFDEKAEINLNPFIDARVENGTISSEDLSFLLPLLCKMANVTDTVQIGMLEEAIIEVFSKKLNDTTITDIYKFLKKKKSTEDLSKMLFSYTIKGRFGRFFHKGKPLTFKNVLTVLELEALRSKKELQAIVLLFSIFHINKAIMSKKRGLRKLLVIDEAWDLLQDEFSAKFIENAYRIYRKYGAAAISITQSIHDLYVNNAGRAIVENADFFFLLRQKPEALQTLLQSGRLLLSEENFNLLRTVKTIPGEYSEIFLYTPLGSGIARFSPDPFSYWLYTTRPADLQKIAEMEAEGKEKTEILKELAQKYPKGAQ